MPDLSNPTKPGASTIEGKLATAGVILGAIISGLTVALAALAESFPAIGWLGTVAGALVVVGSVLGIAKSRGQVKAADIIAQAAKAIAGVQGTQTGLSALGVAPTPPTPLIAAPGTLSGTPPPK